MIIARSHDAATVKITKPILDLFAERRVLFSSDGRDRLKLGQSLQLTKGIRLEPYCAFFKGDGICTAGTMTYVAGTMNKAMNRISVGRYCSLGAFDIAQPQHPIESVTSSVFAYNREKHALVKSMIQDSGLGDTAWARYRVVMPSKAPPVIGNDVFFGKDVLLSTGIRIGDGAVIAAGSVVTRDVAPYTIVGGNPAKLIRRRFDDGIIEDFLELQWWNYQPKDLAIIPMQDPAEFIRLLRERRQDLEPYAPRPFHVWDEVQALL
ncbi:MAG: Capsular polysaccharide synthesis enzyme Cap5H [Belnapia sp.]|nr:Capsular polysaccharide synthesis enzyme Cap5H [Belnapia sp.]